ncbi:MAG: ergothioneine biosynthesis glutamate--cysteine ligase EgtA [Actinobacteria bacterium]|nr:ergothioneine biosynthesis glutamate--cysteine ligase EgtA [Actinomycetota bacterium]MBI3688876.1 ergothioneine biosynthesis glutamate--cysteine ligase EgtA [Actinomycetota bacterium]
MQACRQDECRPLTESAAEAHVAGTCFKTGPPGRVGVELEWLLHDARDPLLPVPASRLDGVLVPVLVHGALSTEPGGQLELSSRPAPTLAECLVETSADLAALRTAAARRGVRLAGLGVDPVRPPTRLVDTPRYLAMERYFDRHGPDGRVMMCSTASVQVCLEAGTADDGFAVRWNALHAIGPVLVAAFANSPVRAGRPTGWRSTRQAVWARLGADRGLAPAGRNGRNGGGPGTADPAADWARRALDADVLAIQVAEGPWEVPTGLSFRAWLRGEGPRRPTVADLDYHLTTLFPPVRPRGCLELRVLDAQSGDRWRVAATVVAALLDDPAARDLALAAAEPVGGRWLAAARDGLSDPRFAVAARACFSAALDGAVRLGAPAQVVAELVDFIERFPEAGRCPADDVLDVWVSQPDRIPLVEESVPC